MKRFFLSALLVLAALTCAFADGPFCPISLVMMTSGSHTLFEAKEVEFQAGVIVESGAVLEIQNPNHQHGAIFDSNNN